MSLDLKTARNALPHPLAQLCNRLHAHDPMERLKEHLAFVEGVARHLAWTLVAEAAAHNADAKTLARWMRAKSFGAFLYVIDECLAARHGRAVFLPEVERLRRDAWGTFALAREIRNDDAHDYIPRDPIVAARHLNALEPAVRALVDALEFLTRWPLGVLHPGRVTHEGVTEAHWVPCRGPTVRNPPVMVRDAVGVPNELLLLLDLDGRRALTLAPFFVCDRNAFCWLELPAPEDRARRGAYRRPVADDSLPAWVPDGLLDVTAAAPAGLSLDAWLRAPEQRPRIVPLRLDDASRARVRAASQPTMLMDAAPAVSTPAAYAPTVMQPPLAHAPTVLAPPPAPTLRPVVSDVAARPSPRLPRAAVAAVALSSLVVFAAVSVFAWRSRDAAPTAAPPPLTAETTLRAIPDRPLAERPDLRDFTLRWVASVTNTTYLDEATGRRYMPEALDGFYAPFVSYHGVRRMNATTIAPRWEERRAFNLFEVDPAQSSWLPTPNRLSQGATLSGGDDNDVLLLSLAATEKGARVVRATYAAVCPRVAGRYLLEVRRRGGQWQVCTETWRDADLYASCPPMRPPTAR